MGCLKYFYVFVSTFHTNVYNIQEEYNTRSFHNDIEFLMYFKTSISFVVLIHASNRLKRLELLM